MKNKILILSVAAAVLGLLLACPTFHVIKKTAQNDGLLFLYEEWSNNVLGIASETDEIEVIYHLNDFSSYITAVALDEGRLYISDYCKQLYIHDKVLVIDNDGNQADYFTTVTAPIGLATAGDYLVVGGGNFYPPDSSTYYAIYDKNTLETIREPAIEKGILWGKTSVHEYNEGIILVFGNHLQADNAILQYLSGEGLTKTDQWSAETYDYLEPQKCLQSEIYNDSLLLVSETYLNIALLPLPLGSGPETVIDFKPLLGVGAYNHLQRDYWWMQMIGISGNELIGYIAQTGSNRSKLFKYDLDTGEMSLIREMEFTYLDIPVYTLSATANNKLYTGSYDTNGNVENAINVYSLDDFSFIKKMSFDDAEAKCIIIDG